MMRHNFDLSDSNQLAETNEVSTWQRRVEALKSEIDTIQSEISRLTPSTHTRIGVASLIKARRQRAIALDMSLFSDPAWDILLQLYECEISQRRISVSKLSFATDVPSTTVLRWLGLLERRQLIVRTEDPFDARRIWVTLSESGSQAMAKYFASLPFSVSAAAVF